MNIRRLWVILAMLFVTAASVGFAVPATLAYQTAKTETLVNTFTLLRYPPSETSVDVSVRKEVRSIGTQSIGPEGFHFKLQNTQSNESFTLTTDANGFASVTLPFSDADIGKNHTYRLVEINDGRENVNYSDQVYIIQIEITVDAQNQTVASVCVDGVPVEQIVAVFENEYNAGDVILPPTGDDTNLELYIALLFVSCAGLALLMTKWKCRAIK